LLLALLLATPSTAQTPTESPYPFGEVYSVEVVLVPVAVRGAKPGQRFPRSAFTLRVDGRPQVIESFDDDLQAPVSLVFLQDLSGSMADPGKMESSREALDCFLDTLRAGDEMALATFAHGRTEVEVPLARAAGAIREAMELWEPFGITGLYDAVSLLPEISLGGGGVKRAAILVSDGIDNASELTPEQARDLVQRAELPVYVFALPGRELDDEVATFRYADLLQDLAEATGGQYYALETPTEARRICAAILGELRHRYVLGFSVSGTGPSTYHPIAVEVRGRPRRSGLVHRRGYRGTAPNPPRRP
jgi:Ca-activated chloride channel family protein